MAGENKTKKTITSYWPNCMVCQYMKKNRDFRMDVMRSTYFDPSGTESLIAVNDRYGGKFKQATLYRHMSQHQRQDIARAERVGDLSGEPSKVWQRHVVRPGIPKRIDGEALLNTVEVVESPITKQQQYEIGLDEFITLGRDRLKHNEMAISAANYIQAIKVKAEIERTTKDRRLEMLRSMFAGAAPVQKVEDGQSL